MENNIPIIDLSARRSKVPVSTKIVKACEKYGFFMVVNHDVPLNVVEELEQQGLQFFARPMAEKRRAGPGNPYGYGCNSIGPNGDMGALEYLTLSTNPGSPDYIARRARTISNRPSKFSSAASEYAEAVRGLACMLLDLTAEGLRVLYDTSVFSNLITDDNSDSILRLNYYPPSNDHGIGFGEHTDPQIFTILRSNAVGGLQISTQQGDRRDWIPVPPKHDAFCVFVGDTLKAMTNGRFVSVRHRALTNSQHTRMSIAFFGAPSLQALIAPLPEMIPAGMAPLYRPFTWDEYKRAMYTRSLRLGDDRLNCFRA